MPRGKKTFILFVFFVNNKTEKGYPAKRDLKRGRKWQRKRKGTTGKKKGKAKEKEMTGEVEKDKEKGREDAKFNEGLRSFTMYLNQPNKHTVNLQFR